MKHPDDNKTIDMMDKTFSQLESGIKGMEVESRRGRKPLVAAEPVTDVADPTALAETNQAAADLAAIQSAITAGQIQFSQWVGERIGRRHMADLMQKVVTVTDLIALQEIKSSKAYRGMTHSDPSGKLITITSWADFCTVIEGRSAAAVDLDLLNLRQLGSDLFSSMQRIGLGPAKMRELRQIPEAERVELLEQTGSKELTEEVIADLLDKHRKQLADKDKQVQAAEKKKVEAEQSAEAARRVAAEKNTVIDHLREKLERPYTPDPDSVAQTQEQEAALKELQVAFALAHTNTMRVAAVCSDVFDRFDGTPLADHARACIDDIVRALAGMASTHGINVDLTLKEALTPAWLPR